MKKTELQEHRALYNELLSHAFAAERAGEHRIAVRKALEAWQFIDGMMQYERRYDEREFDSIKAIDLVLNFAPLLLDFESLDELDDLLRNFRRIEKNTSQSLADKLAGARSRLRDAHRLYDHLERNPGGHQDELRRALGGNQDSWRELAEAWEKVGLISRQAAGRSYALYLATRLGKIVCAICPACGARTEAPKAMLLEQLPCPECAKEVLFVILADNAHPEEEK